MKIELECGRDDCEKVTTDNDECTWCIEVERIYYYSTIAALEAKLAEAEQDRDETFGELNERNMDIVGLEAELAEEKKEQCPLRQRKKGEYCKMKTKFDLQEAIEKWCKENGHDGFYCNVRHCDPCGCKIGDIAPCGANENIIDGDCVGGRLSTAPFADADGNKCDWSIQPHEKGKNDK